MPGSTLLARWRSLGAAGWVKLALFVGLWGYAAVALFGALTQDPSRRPAPRPVASPSGPTLSQTHYDKGHCYNWDLGLNDRSVEDVRCTDLHRFEYVTSREIDTSHYPSDDEFDQFRDQLCDKPVEHYLGGPIDPAGKLYVADVEPLPDGWAEGDRTVYCGIGQEAGLAPYGSTSTEFDAVAGRADRKHQELLPPVGTCFRSTAGDYGSVTCSESHTGEVVGTTLISSPTFPANAYYDEQVEPVCTRQVRAYLGRALRKNEFVNFDALSAKSWAAGSRRISCYVEFDGLQQLGSHQKA